MELNKYQSTFEELKLDSYPDEVQQEFMEFINTVPYIRHLISADRPLVKDLPRDESGRAVIDISHPPILTDTHYFTPTADYYRKYGVVTHLRPNSNPNSEYGKWLKEEVLRCWNGYLRPEDGAWITGSMYFYLNYAPIIVSKRRKNSKVSDRVVDFPAFWEGIWWRYLYWELARNNAKHCAEIAKRGAGKSYSISGELSRIFHLGDNAISNTNLKAAVIAYQKEYLTKDGTLNKFIDMINFVAGNTQFPALRLKESMQELTWTSGFKDVNTGIIKGSQNTVLGVSAKDDIDKVRGKRPHPYYCKVLTPEGYKLWGDIQIGDIIYSSDGKETKVIDIPFDGEEPIYKITLKDKRVTYAGQSHLFRVGYWHGNSKTQVYTWSTKDVLEIKSGTETYTNGHKYSLPKQECLDFKEQSLFIDPYVMGLFLGDGCYNSCRDDKIDLTMLRADIDNIEKHIPYPVIKSYNRDITHRICLLGNTENKAKYYHHAKNMLDYYGLKDADSGTKFIPKQYLFNSKENREKLLKGLLDTDGTCSTAGTVEYATKSKRLAEDFMFLCRSLGINCSCYLKTFMRNDNVYYRIKLHVYNRQLFNLERKQRRVSFKTSKYSKAFSDRSPIVSVEYAGIQKCKCVTVDSPSHEYLIDDFIVTHNSSKIFIEEFGNFPKVVDMYRVLLPSVQDGDDVFGQINMLGTGGSEGADFAGAHEIIYNPDGYYIQSLPNVFDKSSQGKGNTIFFFGAPINRKGCYNEDGISDVTKALLQICYDRYIVKYNTSDPMALTRTKAENPVTLQEAIMRRDSSMFPVSALVDRIDEIKSNPSFFDDVYTGDLVMKKNGTVEFVPTTKQPIRFFPHKDNNLEGAIEIFKMPEKDKNGRVFNDRYIASSDPFDDDSSETLSLGSTFILDLWTDTIVAEYTGRSTFADDYFEKTRLLCLFFNARLNYEQNKKGLFSYFSRMNSLYLLFDTFTYLKDKDLIKGEIGIGNKSKGVNATAPINNYARTLIRDWLIRPFTKIEIVDGKEVEVTIMNLQRIRNLALLIELSQWNSDGNFDRVSSLGMLMIAREDRMITYGGDISQAKNRDDSKDLSNDDFFSRNYDKRFNIKKEI